MVVFREYEQLAAAGQALFVAFRDLGARILRFDLQLVFGDGEVCARG